MMKKMYVLSLSIFILSVILSLSILILNFSILIVVHEIVPFIIMLILNICFGMLTYHCYQCMIYFKKLPILTDKKIRRNHINNTIIMCISLINITSMSMILLYSMMILKWFSYFQIYFLIVDVVFIIYFVIVLLIDINIKKYNGNRKN